MGWNVVTSMFDVEARNHGYASMPAHTERYRRADEFVEAVLKLWDSWTDDALQCDRGGQYADPEKVRPIHHRGEYFLVDGPSMCRGRRRGTRCCSRPAPRSKAGTGCPPGRGHLCRGLGLACRPALLPDIKRRVRLPGAAPVPIMPGLVTYVAATVEEAKAKQRELDGLLPVAASLRQLGLFTAQDCMSWELDAPVPPLPSLEAFPGPKGRYSTILRIIETEHPTVRQLLGRLAAGGGHCTW